MLSIFSETLPHSRLGHSYFPTMGYKGVIRLLEKIPDALMDRKDRDAGDVNTELVM